MVNVAGRSKGCATCRRRKVKCDLTLPHCQRCIGLGLQCPGPRTGAFFVNSGSATGAPVSTRRSNGGANKPKAASNATKPPDVVALTPPHTSPATSPGTQLSPASASALSTASSHKDAQTQSYLFFDFNNGTALPASAYTHMPAFSAVQPCLAGAADQFFVAHFVDTFANLRGLSSQASAGNWLVFLPSLLTSPGNVSVQAAIRSTAMMSYGSLISDASIKDESFRWYTRALRHLRTLLAQGPATISETTVCTAVMLVHFESLAGGSPGAWLQHVKGVSKMLEAAGPASCRDGFMHHIFRHTRLQTFFATMHESQMHSFASPDWMSVPYDIHPKHSFDHLIDAFFTLQRCLAIAEQLVQCDDVQRRCSLAAALRGMTRETKRQLEVWQDEYQASKTPSPSRSPAGSPASENSPPTPMAYGPERSLALDVSTPPATILTSLFHAASLINFRLLTLLHSSEMGYRREAHRHTRAILSSFESLVKSSGSSGPKGGRATMMMLPQLKIVNLWGTPEEERLSAGTLLARCKGQNAASAAVFGAVQGYFAHVAARVEKV